MPEDNGITTLKNRKRKGAGWGARESAEREENLKSQPRILHPAKLSSKMKINTYCFSDNH